MFQLGQSGHCKALADMSAILQVSISVQDSGCGIPADQHDVIFDAFNQVSHACTLRYPSSFLPLYRMASSRAPAERRVPATVLSVMVRICAL